ncbi:MAG: ACP S-malonyltransferase [candidate division Zixibacteria bacterium]|nr:ACP S-malonyltransferase [candidate division Zixibacteria bacterium]
MGENSNKVAFVFPGQASQYVGMAKEFVEEYPPASEMFDTAADILGFDLKKICLEGPADKLVQTMYTQPALFLHSVIADRFLAENGIRPHCGAGHSLGEISALTAAGVLSFEDGLKVVRMRSSAMQTDCDNNPGTMAAVIGLGINKIKEICESIDGIVQPANFNSSSQIAVSGEIEAVDEFMAKAKDAGAKRVVKLAVGGAYHSPLMQSTMKKLEELFEDISFSRAEFPVAANVTAGYYNEDKSPAEYLVKQIQSPVLWHPSMEFLASEGVNTFIEVGPGNVLQGLIKRSVKGVELGSFEKPGQLQAVRELIEGK